MRKSSLLSDDNSVSSSDDKSTTTGCRDVICMRRANANSSQIGVASVIHPVKYLFSTLQGGYKYQACHLIWCEGCEG